MHACTMQCLHNCMPGPPYGQWFVKPTLGETCTFDAKQRWLFPHVCTSWHLVHCHIGWRRGPDCWWCENHAAWPAPQGCESGTWAINLMTFSSYVLWQLASSQSRSAQQVLKGQTTRGVARFTVWFAKLARCWMSLRLAKACTFCLVAVAHSIIWCHVFVA